MKTFLLRSGLAASCLLLAGLAPQAARADKIAGPGWLDVNAPALPVADAAGDSAPAAPSAQTASLTSFGQVQTFALVAGPSPTAVTPELQALATGLNNDPLRIFNYVRNKVEYQPYWGSHKGAHTTYLDGAGNDMDQCSLLIALLNAAGYSNCNYVYGQISVPDTATDGNDLEHWIGTSSAGLAINLLGNGRIPNISGLNYEIGRAHV